MVTFRHQDARLRNPLRFFSDLVHQPTGVAVWVFALMVVNLAALAFWSEPLAKVIVVTFMLSSMLMMGLYTWFGFERILGLGHVLWVPLLAAIVMHLSEADGAFAAYLILVALSIGISLIFDVRDVWIYLSSKRAQH